MDEIKILLDLAQANASHIEILNREMGTVMAQVEMIKWFIGINLVTWVGAIVGIVVRNFINRK